MSYPRTASTHSQSAGQTMHPPSQLPVRSRTHTALYPNQSSSQNKLTPNLQLGRYPNQPPTNSQLTPQSNARQAPNTAPRDLKAFITQYRGTQYRSTRYRSTRYRSIVSKKAAWIGVGAIALFLLTVIPARVSSKSISSSRCEKKVKPTGEISRGQMTALLAIPTGAKKAAVRQAVDEPYCTLPAIAQPTPDEKAEGSNAIAGAEREAYPLAFDPEAWVVIAYSQTGEYVGYDFVFNQP